MCYATVIYDECSSWHPFYINLSTAAPSLTFVEIDHNADEGTSPQLFGNVTVVCKATGRPKPSIPVWKYSDGTKLTNSSRIFISSNLSYPSSNGLDTVSTSIRILNVMRSDLIAYTCESANGVDGAATHSTFLGVSKYTSTATFILNVESKAEVSHCTVCLGL